MSNFRHFRWLLLLGVLALAWIIIIGAIQLAGVRQTYSLQNAKIQHDAGCAYVIQLNPPSIGWPITEFRGDTSSASISQLVLLEDARAIGRPHTLHDEIRANGLGNYSHWERALYFSTSDCSDPRSNGRHYEVIIPLAISQWGIGSWLVAVAILGWTTRKSLKSDYRLRQLVGFAKSISDTLLSSLDISQRPVIGIILFILMSLCAGGFLVWSWSAGETTTLAVGGAYQISDSKDYWICANSLLDMKHFGNTTVEECQRRAIYPTFLSGIALLAQGNIFGTLLLQAIITSAAIFILVRRSCRYVGSLGAVVCAVLLFKYATVNLFASTMTENAGLVFGCAGLALLLEASEKKSLPLVVTGISMISVALSARAGAFFILPSLVIWAGLAAFYFKERIGRWVAAASLAILAGFALQSMLVLAVGGNPDNSFGNFSYVLYGLSVGGKGWTQVQIDYPELFSNLKSDSLKNKAIYALAWKNLASRPESFLDGLFKNLSLFWAVGTYGFNKLGTWAFAAKMCWWLAWIPVCLKFKHPAYSLITLFSFGVLFSAPFLVGDGGERVFAASVAGDVIQIGIGLYWVGTILIKGVRSGFAPVITTRSLNPLSPASKKISLEVFFSLLLSSMLFIPFTAPGASVKRQWSNDEKCSSNEYTVVTNIGNKGSMLLDFVDDNKRPDVFRGEMVRDKFVRGLPPSTWYREGAISFKGSALLTAFQFDHGDEYAPGPYFIISDIHLSQYFGRTVRLCIDKTKHEKVFDNEYHRLDSVVVLD
jgi:hypothetical protein